MPYKILEHKMLHVLAFFAFFSAKGYGQKGYVSGYIISLTNDTIRAQINLNGLEKNRCVYLVSSGKSCIGNQETVKEFAVSGGRTFRYIKIDGAKNTVEAYCEVLVNGKINLFSYKKRFFVQKANGEIIELLNTIEKGTTERGAKYVRDKKEYVGVLKYLLSDATTAVPDVTSIDLLKKDLIQTIRIYNEGETYVQQLDRLRYKPNVKYGIEVLLTRDNYKFRFLSESFVDNYNGYFFLPGIGGTIKYQFQSHLSINFAARFKYLDYSIYKSFGAESSKRYYTLKNNFITMSIPITLDWQFNNLAFCPFVGMGFQFEKSFMKNTTYLEEQNKYSTLDFYTYEHQARFLNPINTYWTVELGGSPTIGKHSFNLKAQYLMDISILNSQIYRQFYHKSGLQLVLGLMF